MKLTPHMKLAIFIAPFLLVGGYIAGDLYEEKKAESRNLFKLVVQGECDIVADSCSLTHEKLTVKLSDQNGLTQLDANHSIETATLSIVDNQEKEWQYRLAGEPEGLNWQANTELDNLLKQQPNLKIRLIVTVNKGYYFSEFTTARSAK